MKSRSKYLLKDPLKSCNMLKNNKHLSFCLSDIQAHVHYVFISHGQDQHRFATTLRRLGYVPTSLYLAYRIHKHVLFGIHRVSIWGQIQAYTSSVIQALTGTISLRLFFIASGMASPIANILYLCIWVSLGTAPEHCQEKRRKQKQWRFTQSIGLDLGGKRRNDWSLRQEGSFSYSLFHLLFTPVCSS